MKKRTLEQAFKAVFHNKDTFENFCTVSIGDEVNKISLLNGRTVFVPTDKLKKHLRFIDRVVFRYLAKDEDIVHSFTKGKNTLTAVKMHEKSKFFFLTDIEAFYSNVKSDDVLNILNRDKELIPISDFEKYIGLILRMTTYGGSIPVGFATSPQISNAFLYEFDQAVRLLCKNNSLIYTRYADDIIISGKKFEELSELKNLIQELLHQYASPNQFLKKSKTRITHSGNKVKILGLNILPNGKITVDSKYKKKIELLLYFYTNDEDKYGDFLNKEFKGDERSIFGLLHYVNSVDPAYLEKLQRKYGLYALRSLMEKQDA